MRPVFLVVVARMLRRSDYFLWFSMSRKLLKSSKPVLVNALLTVAGFLAPRSGLSKLGSQFLFQWHSPVLDLKILSPGFVTVTVLRTVTEYDARVTVRGTRQKLFESITL